MPRVFLSLLLLLVGLPLASLHAQGVVFTAEADRTSVGVGEPFQITYRIEGTADLSALETTLGADFEALSAPMDARGSSISVVNGRRAQSVHFSRTVLIKAKRAGQLTIPAATARTADGRTYRSNAVKVEAVRGRTAPAPSSQQPSAAVADPFFADPFFGSPFAATPPPRQPSAQELSRDILIRTSVPRTAVYVGECVPIFYTLYSRLTVQARVTALPQPSGAWVQPVPLEQQQPRDAVLDGRPFRSVLVARAMAVPQVPGTLVLESAEAEGSAQVEGTGPFGAIPVRIRSQPISLRVMPLPEAGKPLGFSGSVGRYTLAARLDTSTTRTERGAVLTLTLRGPAGMQLVPTPKLQLPAGIQAFDPQVRDSVLPDGSGVKTVRYALATPQSGRYTIPPQRFYFFDPARAAYDSVRTAALPLDVQPGTALAADASVTSGRRKQLPSAVWIGLAVGCAGIGGFAASRMARRKKTPQDVPATTATDASAIQPVSPVVVAPVHQNIWAGAHTHADVLRALRTALGAALGASAASLNTADVMRALGEHGVPDAVQERLHNVWQCCEAGAYAPDGLHTLDAAECAREAEGAVAQLQRFMGSKA